MVSELHSKVRTHLKNIFEPGTKVNEEISLVRNLPQSGEPYFQEAKELYERWLIMEYPIDPRSRWRTIDFQIGESHLLIEVDGDQHWHNGYRKDSFALYPSSLAVHYDWETFYNLCSEDRRVQRAAASSGYEKSKHFRHRDQERAFRDLLADFVAWDTGYKLVRISSGSLPPSFSDQELRQYITLCLDNPRVITIKP